MYVRVYMEMVVGIHANLAWARSFPQGHLPRHNLCCLLYCVAPYKTFCVSVTAAHLRKPK